LKIDGDARKFVKIRKFEEIQKKSRKIKEKQGNLENSRKCMIIPENQRNLKNTRILKY
jgi:hypothetical protein